MGFVAQRETQTLRHVSELGTWELVLARPQRHLRGIVEQYSGYTETGAAGGVLRQEVPSTRVPLIVNFGATWRLSDASGKAGERRDSFLAGLHESSTFVAADGPAACVQVDFTPIGAHLFLGLPMHEPRKPRRRRRGSAREGSRCGGPARSRGYVGRAV